MDISDGLNIVFAVALIVMAFLNRRQIDLGQVNQLIDRLAPQVAASPTQADDIALEIAKTLRDMLSQPGNPASDEGGDIVGEFNENRGV